jgi:exosortase/archaeosortase family protein
MLGIEDACSGVRSLQATFMISLFLGELYNFAVRRRVQLVAAGALLAFVCNLVRTAILIWVGTTRGMEAIHAWHDPAGLTILLVCLFGLWAISLWMQRGLVAEPVSPESGALRLPFRPSPALLGSVAAWLLLTEAGVQIWYNAHAAPLRVSRWSAQWPATSEDFSKVPIALEAENLLRYNEGGGGSWKGADGHRWTMYFFRWLPGRTAALFVKIHRPDVCLPASGMKMVNDNGIQLIDLNGVKLPIRSYRFDDHGTPLHVFYCYWDARSSYENNKAASEEDWSAAGRIRAALRGRRETGAQMLELVVSGYEDNAAAATALQQQLRQIVVRG